MPIPQHTNCNLDVFEDACCNSFFLMGERILAVAWSGISGCLEEDCGAREFRVFQTFGERVQDPLGDSLIANFSGASLHTTTSPRNRLMPALVARLTWRVELRENGFPMIQRNDQQQIVVPDWRNLQHATQHTMSHAEKMWRTLADAAASRPNGLRMFPLPVNTHVLDGGVGVSPLRPIGPQANQAAWSVDVSVDVKLDALASLSGS